MRLSEPAYVERISNPYNVQARVGRRENESQSFPTSHFARRENHHTFTGVCVVASALLIAPVFSIHYDFLFANGVSINIGENCNLNGDGTSGLLAMDFFVTVKKTRGCG